MLAVWRQEHKEDSNTRRHNSLLQIASIIYRLYKKWQRTVPKLEQGLLLSKQKQLKALSRKKQNELDRDLPNRPWPLDLLQLRYSRAGMRAQKQVL